MDAEPVQYSPGGGMPWGIQQVTNTSGKPIVIETEQQFKERTRER